MIAKKIARRRDSKSSFSSLAQYILRDNDNSNNESIEYKKITNCRFDSSSLAILEIEATQARNTRSKSDKTYHLVISFAAGERPIDEVLIDIENNLCRAIGYEEHQRMSVLHTDTDNVHLHVAINKVHPKTYNNIEVIRDFYRLDEVCQAMEKKHNLSIDNRIDRSYKKSLAKDAEEIHANQSNISEIRGGIVSFKRWLYEQFKDGLSDRLKSAKSWDHFHAFLKEHDLEIKPYKKGLVIGSITEQVYAKASAFISDFGQNKLELKLGPYESCSVEIKAHNPNKNIYKKIPVHETANEILWQHYQRTQRRIIELKKDLFEDIKTQKMDEIDHIKKHFASLRSEVKASWVMSKYEKWKMYQELHNAKTKQLNDVAVHYKEELARIHKAHPRRGWQDFLIDEALNGDLVALKTLRRKINRKVKGREKNGLTGRDNVVALRDFKPVDIKANGDALYNIEGINVRDSGDALLIEHNDPKAVDLVLRLGIEKYGCELSVEGSEYFQLSVVQSAFDSNMNVVFTNPALEQRRKFLHEIHLEVQEKLEKVSNINDKDSQINNDLISKWIKSRNTARSTTKDNKPYVFFTKNHKGDYMYAGCRKVADSCFVALYESNRSVVIVPVTAKQQYVLRQHRIGDEMYLDNKGHGVIKNKGLER